MITRTASLVTLTLGVVLAACSRGAENAGDTATQGNTAAASATGAAGTSLGASASAAPTTTTGTATASGMVDPSTASREQLLAVPGMTPQAADALVGGRPYNDMVAVDRRLAAQIPDTAARKRLYAQLWKPIDLNTARDEEILLIPGVGRRMLREFKEYRPYRDMARFRREIGKYVDQAEVARLEKYVSIR